MRVDGRGLDVRVPSDATAQQEVPAALAAKVGDRGVPQVVEGVVVVEARDALPAAEHRTDAPHAEAGPSLRNEERTARLEGGAVRSKVLFELVVRPIGHGHALTARVRVGACTLE